MYQYQYQYRFFGSINSSNYYISPTYHISCSLSVPYIPPFLSQNPIFWLCNSSTLSITSSEYRYLHKHWISTPYFLRKIVHRVQKPIVNSMLCQTKQAWTFNLWPKCSLIPSGVNKTVYNWSYVSRFTFSSGFWPTIANAGILPSRVFGSPFV